MSLPTPAYDIHDPRPCELGEGPLWHPLRQQLFWFDILGNRLMSRTAAGAPLEWRFDEHVSTAGWVSQDALLIVSETGFWHFEIESGTRRLVAPLEADRPETRSNDGRADPQGGFWVGTMGKKAEHGAGAIHRYYRGELRTLFSGLSIPNTICFAPSGDLAYYADTPTQKILRQPLDAEGWPKGRAETLLDLSPEGLYPDGAVVDREGYLWIAQWGAGRVARYSPEGRFDQAITVGGDHASCPAFGGPDLRTLFVTTAQEGLEAPEPRQGLLYHAPAPVAGQEEHQVRL